MFAAICHVSYCIHLLNTFYLLKDEEEEIEKDSTETETKTVKDSTDKETKMEMVLTGKETKAKTDHAEKERKNDPSEET